MLNRITASWRPCEGKSYKATDGKTYFKLSPLEVSSNRTTAVSFNQSSLTWLCQDVLASVNSYVVKSRACGYTDRTVTTKIVDAVISKIQAA